MQAIEREGYTNKEILDEIHFRRGSNEVKFRYDLLDKKDNLKFTLKNVIDAEISMAAFAQVKRTARFKVEEGEEIEWLSDKIQPFYMLKMPDKFSYNYIQEPTTYRKIGNHKVGQTKVGGVIGNLIKTTKTIKGKWLEWSLGIFVLSSPDRLEEDGRVIRDIEAYDGLIVLKDDKFTTRYTILKDTLYTDAINIILADAGITKTNIQYSDLKLKTDKEYEPGAEKLEAITELLKELNYTPLWVDEMGYYTSSSYHSPAERAIEYEYLDDEVSILSGGMQETLDLFNVANSWVMLASNPEEEPLVATYINDNIESPTSTINRGRVIVDHREVESVANQEALDNSIKRIAFEASQVFGYLEFETALNPLHSYSDILKIRYKSMKIEDKYAETHWTMPLKAGATMKHSARKVVEI